MAERKEGFEKDVCERLATKAEHKDLNGGKGVVTVFSDVKKGSTKIDGIDEKSVEGLTICDSGKAVFDGKAYTFNQSDGTIYCKVVYGAIECDDVQYTKEAGPFKFRKNLLNFCATESAIAFVKYI